MNGKLASLNQAENPIQASRTAGGSLASRAAPSQRHKSHKCRRDKDFRTWNRKVGSEILQCEAFAFPRASFLLEALRGFAPRVLARTFSFAPFSRIARLPAPFLLAEALFPFAAPRTPFFARLSSTTLINCFALREGTPNIRAVSSGVTKGVVMEYDSRMFFDPQNTPALRRTQRKCARVLIRGSLSYESVRIAGQPSRSRRTCTRSAGSRAAGTCPGSRGCRRPTE
jgi:hypothetical protein